MPADTVVATSEAVRRGERSAREVVEAALDAVADTTELNAWTHVDAEGALAAADELDASRRRGDDLGPLAGVPFGVKDLEDCRGMPTRRGSRWYADAPPAARDDIHVARLRAAGAVPIGKTATPEFGWACQTSSPAHGITRNPWNTDRTPGGSSGGTAAAVSAGVVAFGTASDGGGSIRTPANFCGLPGLRPSYGRVASFGETHVAQQAVVFALATTMTDTARLLDVAAGPDPRDRTCLPPAGVVHERAIEDLDVRGLRVGVTMNFGLSDVAAATERIVRSALADLVGAAGLVVVNDVELELDPFFEIYQHVDGIERFIDVGDGLWPDRADELDRHVRPGWERASGVRLPDAAQVERARRALVHRVAAWFDEVDVVVTPTSSTPAFPVELPWPDTIDGADANPWHCICQPIVANLVNLPALSVPAGIDDDGLPVGMQLIGPRHREDLLLRLGRISEQARPWPRLAP